MAAKYACFSRTVCFRTEDQTFLWMTNTSAIGGEEEEGDEAPAVRLLSPFLCSPPHRFSFIPVTPGGSSSSLSLLSSSVHRELGGQISCTHLREALPLEEEDGEMAASRG